MAKARSREENKRLREMYERCGPEFRARAAQFCRDSADVDDVVQETLVVAVERGVLGLPEPKFRVWMRRALRLVALRQNRREAGRRNTLERFKSQRPPGEAVAPESPEARCAALIAETCDLSERERTIMHEHYLEGRTFVDIGRRMGMPAATVRTVHRRTLAKMRAALA